MRQWLETEDFTEKPKDMMTFPIFTTEVAKDLEEETRTFVKDVFFDPAGGQEPAHVVDGALRVPQRAHRRAVRQGRRRHDPDQVDLDPNAAPRPADPGQLPGGARRADQHVGGQPRRASSREEILCSDVPPPPAEFKFDEKNITEDMTAREKFVEHSKNPACKGCHVLFDTIGFALENYDAVGKWRTTEKGKTIDPSGSIPLPSGGDLQFANFVDLIDKLAKGTDAYDCFSSQFLSVRHRPGEPGRL